MSTEGCQHIEEKKNEDGEIIRRPYKNIFCPDCGSRLVDDYKAKAFKIRKQ